MQGSSKDSACAMCGSTTKVFVMSDLMVVPSVVRLVNSSEKSNE